ncbi:unnamed protein product [Colias eurytheme]|nr:unnamed protein product [Colias eurytheme]
MLSPPSLKSRIQKCATGGRAGGGGLREGCIPEGRKCMLQRRYPAEAIGLLLSTHYLHLYSARTHALVVFASREQQFSSPSVQRVAKMAAKKNLFENLHEFNEEEIRDIRMLFALDPPDSKKRPPPLVDSLADNEAVILQKVLISMNETRIRVRVHEQKRVVYLVCSRCGKPFKRGVRAWA